MVPYKMFSLTNWRVKWNPKTTKSCGKFCLVLKKMYLLHCANTAHCMTETCQVNKVETCSWTRIISQRSRWEKVGRQFLLVRKEHALVRNAKAVIRQRRIKALTYTDTDI